MQTIDPLRKSDGPKCCDAQHSFFNDMVGCDPSTMWGAILCLRGAQEHMRGREFITLLGVAATWRLAGHARQLDRARRIGVLIGLLRANFLC